MFPEIAFVYFARIQRVSARALLQEAKQNLKSRFSHITEHFFPVFPGNSGRAHTNKTGVSRLHPLPF